MVIPSLNRQRQGEKSRSPTGIHKEVGIRLCQFIQFINGGVFGCAINTCRIIDVDATPDPPSLSLSFARGQAKVQAWGRVGGRYFLNSSANSSVNKWGINEVLRIIYLEITNSTSFGGFRCYTRRCSNFMQSYIIWSKHRAGTKGLENGPQITLL